MGLIRAVLRNARATVPAFGRQPCVSGQLVPAGQVVQRPAQVTRGQAEGAIGVRVASPAPLDCMGWRPGAVGLVVVVVLPAKRPGPDAQAVARLAGPHVADQIVILKPHQHGHVPAVGQSPYGAVVVSRKRLTYQPVLAPVPAPQHQPEGGQIGFVEVHGHGVGGPQCPGLGPIELLPVAEKHPLAEAGALVPVPAPGVEAADPAVPVPADVDTAELALVPTECGRLLRCRHKRQRSGPGTGSDHPRRRHAKHQQPIVLGVQVSELRPFASEQCQSHVPTLALARLEPERLGKLAGKQPQPKLRCRSGQPGWVLRAKVPQRRSDPQVTAGQTQHAGIVVTGRQRLLARGDPVPAEAHARHLSATGVLGEHCVRRRQGRTASLGYVRYLCRTKSTYPFSGRPRG